MVAQWPAGTAPAVKALFVLAAVVLGGVAANSAVWGSDLPPVTVTFSKDERTAAIRRGARQWELARPVLSPWKYEAKEQIYWVAPEGKDANQGSKEKPFRTIEKALSRTAPGDIVYIQPGLYVESLTLKHSGQEGKPIVLSSAPDALGKVKITPSPEYVRKNPSGAVITVVGAYHAPISHVWINGLVIEGPKGRPEAPKSEMYGANGITWSGTGPGCRATNNVVYGNVHCGLKQMNSTDTGVLAEANIIFDNGTEGRDHGIYVPASGATLNGNIIFDNAGYGIHSYEFPKQQTITRNICFENKDAGIILAGSDNKLYHNVCVNNGIGIFYFRKGCMRNDVRNNIFAFNKTDCGYDNGGGKLGDPSDNSDDYNCYFPGKPYERIKPGGHELLADPHFRDAKKGDFRLASQSPCRGKGTHLQSSREKPDLGAFTTTRPQ